MKKSEIIDLLIKAQLDGRKLKDWKKGALVDSKQNRYDCSKTPISPNLISALIDMIPSGTIVEDDSIEQLQPIKEKIISILNFFSNFFKDKPFFSNISELERIIKILEEKNLQQEFEELKKEDKNTWTDYENVWIEFKKIKHEKRVEFIWRQIIKDMPIEELQKTSVQNYFNSDIVNHFIKQTLFKKIYL